MLILSSICVKFAPIFVFLEFGVPVYAFTETLKLEREKSEAQKLQNYLDQL
jgi:hypothetical protein